MQELNNSLEYIRHMSEKSEVVGEVFDGDYGNWSPELKLIS